MTERQPAPESSLPEELVDVLDSIQLSDIQGITGFITVDHGGGAKLIPQIEDMLGHLEKPVNPVIIGGDDPVELLGEVSAMIHSNQEFKGEIPKRVILDLSQIDFSKQDQPREVYRIITALNVGRSYTHPPLGVTIIIVDPLSLEVFKEMPDLWSCRGFVQRMHSDESQA